MIFEFGLFLGKMGRNRVFAIAPKKKEASEFHILTDLLGITLGKYDTEAINPQSAVASACRQIKDKIERPSYYEKEKVLLEQMRKKFTQC